LVRIGELTSLYSLIAFNLISATLSAGGDVGTSVLTSTDGIVDAALIEIVVIRVTLAVDRSALIGVVKNRILVIYLSLIAIRKRYRYLEDNSDKKRHLIMPSLSFKYPSPLVQ
jgi:hypothetical protein